MHLKRRLPHNRTYEELENHYLAERMFADKLKKASREERKKIYATM